MIADWRANLPGLSTFGFVQIAGYTGYGVGPAAADLRQAQLSPLRSLPKIALSTSIDLVLPWSAADDIHPTNKQGVSSRLSAQVLNLEYGAAATVVFPAYAGAAASPATGAAVAVAVALTGCGTGCSVTPQVIPDGVPANVTDGFAVQTDDTAATWWNATATPTADGAGLLLTAAVSAAGMRPVATRYGRAAWPLVTAFNPSGLPVLPWCVTLAGVVCYDVPEAAGAAAGALGVGALPAAAVDAGAYQF